MFKRKMVLVGTFVVGVFCSVWNFLSQKKIARISKICLYHFFYDCAGATFIEKMG